MTKEQVKQLHKEMVDLLRKHTPEGINIEVKSGNVQFYHEEGMFQFRVKVWEESEVFQLRERHKKSYELHAKSNPALKDVALGTQVTVNKEEFTIEGMEVKKWETPISVRNIKTGKFYYVSIPAIERGLVKKEELV